MGWSQSTKWESSSISPASLAPALRCSASPGSSTLSRCRRSLRWWLTWLRSILCQTGEQSPDPPSQFCWRSRSSPELSRWSVRPRWAASTPSQRWSGSQWASPGETGLNTSPAAQGGLAGHQLSPSSLSPSSSHLASPSSNLTIFFEIKNTKYLYIPIILLSRTFSDILFSIAPPCTRLLWLVLCGLGDWELEISLFNTKLSEIELVAF